EQASLTGALRRVFVDDALLHPHSFGADGDGRFDDGWNELGAAEDVDDVHFVRDLFEGFVSLLPQRLFDLRVDGDDAIAGVLHVFRHAVRRPDAAIGQADYGDGAAVLQEFGNSVVHVISESAPLRPESTGGTRPASG